jgi:carboxypeptidase C (cathepsin A)
VSHQSSTSGPILLLCVLVRADTFDSTCVRMKQAALRCEAMLESSCKALYDAMNCAAATAFCYTELDAPLLASGTNLYDLSKQCEGSVADSLCYPVMKQISAWLSRNDTRAALGVDDVSAPFALCSWPVNAAFHAAGDFFAPTYLWVAGLLERGVRTLIYVGENDWTCNWVGNARWVRALEWSGADGFAAVPEGTWSLDGEEQGRAQTYGPLSFVTIRGAGHLVRQSSDGK